MTGNKTWLELRNERLEQERAAQAAEDARLAEAFEQTEEAIDMEALAPIFIEHGQGKVSEPAAFAAQRQREQDLITRDREDYQREIVRKAAEIDVGRGRTVSIGDAVMEPTPEWMEKGEVRTFTPRLEQGTTKTVVAHRRVTRPVLIKLWTTGLIDDDQYAACMWYRAMHDAAGLDGRFKVSRFAEAGSGEGGGSGQAPMALHEREASARTAFRAAREALPAFYLRFFDAVVIEDIPIRRAARFARCRETRAPRRFSDVARDLVRFCDSMKVDLGRTDDDED